MPLTSNLETNVTANTKQFMSALTQAENKATSFSNKIGNALGTLGTAFKGIGATAIIYGFKKVVDEFGNMNDEAVKLGISAQKLQAFAIAGKGAGVSMESFANSISKLKINIGEALGGDKGALSALGRLGLDAQRLSQLSPDEQLLKVADALKQISNINERASLTNKLLGRGGKDQLSLINDGLREAVNNAMKLTASDSAFAKLDEFGDKAAESWTKFKNVMADLVTGVIPLLNIALTGLSAPFELIGRKYKENMPEIAHYLKELNKSTNGAINFLSDQGPIFGEGNQARKPTAQSIYIAELNVGAISAGLGQTSLIDALFGQNTVAAAKSGFTTILAGLEGLREGVKAGASLDIFNKAIEVAGDSVQKFSERTNSITDYFKSQLSAGIGEELSRTFGSGKTAFTEVGTDEFGRESIYGRMIRDTEERVAKDYNEQFSRRIKSLKERTEINPNDPSLLRDLQNIRSSIASKNTPGVNTEAQKGVIEEMKKFIENNVGQKQQVQITVTPSELFNFYVTNSPEFAAGMQNKITDMVAQAARQGAK